MQLHMKIALCVVVLCVIPSGLCIKCFDCRSDIDPKCMDPFDNSTVPITDCRQVQGLSNLPTVCRKIRQNVNGNWHTIRSCGHLEEGAVQVDEKVCIKRAGLNNTVIEQCTCTDKDGCNSSSMFAPLPLLLATLVALSGCVKYL